MGVLPYQQIASKALKTMILQKNERIRPYMPDTRWYRSEYLHPMLERYRSVFIKPDKGGGGAGAIRITKWDRDEVECRTLYGKKNMRLAAVTSWLEKKLNPKKRYIMQQAIRLAGVKGHPFDLRILMQKPGHDWKITGICAKLAAPGKIVTNYCKGGKPYAASKALLEVTSFDNQRAKELFVELYYLSKEIAKTLNDRFTGLKELGIDVGIDEQLRIWIFEVNTRPNFKMFRELKDLQMYRQIKKIHRQIV